MTKITVKLEAFYGYGCGGCSHGSNEIIEVEISEKELDALKGIGEKEISTEDVVELIENGDTSLEPLHEKLEKAFYNMVDEYWLFEAYNEFLYESLYDSMQEDIKNGEYPPVSFEELVKLLEDEEDLDENDFLSDFDAEYCYNEDYLKETYNEYINDKYYDWVREHDHEFIADRVGLDLDACRDDNEVNYIIMME